LAKPPANLEFTRIATATSGRLLHAAVNALRLLS
jgi:hypothetical protein